MKNTYTSLEAIQTRDGNTVVFKAQKVAKFFKKNFEENFHKLTPQEKQEFFHIQHEYGDILDKIWRVPLQEALKVSGAKWALQDVQRNPIEEYNNVRGRGKDADLSQEEHDLKLERLRLYKEWFEKK